MLGLQLPQLLLIVFGLMLPGLPLAAWLLRKQKLPTLDALLIGLTLGWMGVPFLFTLEVIAGILYAPMWIYLNWAVLMLLGLGLCARDGVLTGESIRAFLQPPKLGEPVAFIRKILPGAGLLFLMLSATLIRMTSSGVPIFELDPYFYLDGVRQVVYQGHNYFNDMTAWYPIESSTHIGQPLFKYLVASWFSLYNGAATYSPYTLIDVGSIYPPLAMGLAVFFLYFLFKEIYNERVGLLAGGLGAYLPFFILKLQGGASQIVPYSVFAIFFFIAMFTLLIKRRSWEWAVLSAVGYGAIVLGSNVEILLIFCLSLFLFGVGLHHILQPDENSRQLNKQLLLFIGLLFALELLVLAYAIPFNLKEWFSTIMKTIAVPAVALLIPLAFDWFATLSTYKGMGSELTKRIAPALQPVSDLGRFERAAIFLAFVAVGVIVAPMLPGLSTLIAQYQFWGAYSEPLYRTIAEQAGGAPSFDGAFGFAAMTLQPVDAATIPMAAVINPVIGGMSFLNALPTFLLNLFYNTVAGVLNVYLTTPDGQAGNFVTLDRVNSIATFFLFFGPLLLAVWWVREAWNRRAWPMESLLLLAFIVPVTFMGLEKQKLLTYLGIALIFAAAATVGEAERIARWVGEALGKSDKEKEKTSKPFWSNWPLSPRYLMWALVVLLVLLELGWPLQLGMGWGGPLLAYSMQPTFQQAPTRFLPTLENLCQSNGDPGICGVVNNFNTTVNDPLLFYNPNLCQFSLWPKGGQPPNDVVVNMQYRCGYVSNYWLSSMEWIHANLQPDDRVISWWDYGHWINFFGQTNTVLRNEHTSRVMIGRTAWAYLDGNVSDLRTTMKLYGSRYALMDIEIVGSGNSANSVQLGGKYGALNYLGCAYVNATNVNKAPGSSNCEQSHIWGMILAPVSAQASERCVISESTQQAGIVAYKSEAMRGAQGQAPTPSYCLTQGPMADGNTGIVTYDLNNRSASGDLALLRVRWLPQYQDQSGRYYVLAAFYDHQKLWRDENGTLVDSYDSRPRGGYYDSPLYTGFFVNELEGYDLVYNSPQIRLYKMTDEYWNQK